MKKVITYGTYDLLHFGHSNLLKRANELGDYLIVGVTSDSFDKERGKLNVRNNVLERVEVVKATDFTDEVIIEDYMGEKIDDIMKYNVDYRYKFKGLQLYFYVRSWSAIMSILKTTLYNGTSGLRVIQSLVADNLNKWAN